MELSSKLSPFKDVLDYLYSLCGEGSTGSLYIVTEASQGSVFVLREGKIIDVYFGKIRGVTALQYIKGISKAKCVFKSGANAAPPAKEELYYPLSNYETFKQIGSDFEIKKSEAPNGLSRTKKKILVVEDSAIARKSVVQSLSDRDYLIFEAKDGFEALGKLAEVAPDLVLLDLILPRMDGYAVLTAMKKDDAYKDIPVIVLTSRDTLFDKLRGKMSGSDEYLTKPFTPETLLEKVCKYLEV